MDSGTKTYQVDKHKQLIPLNNDMVNFTCFFEVSSKDNASFNLGIVEQGTMDKPKQYKTVDNGYINGQLESDGQLKSYFLILKAPKPCECKVRIVLKPKEANAPQIQPQIPPDQLPPSQNIISNNDLSQPQTNYFQMKYIVGISAVLILIFIMYKYRKNIFGKFMTSDRLAPSFSSTSF